MIGQSGPPLLSRTAASSEQAPEEPQKGAASGDKGTAFTRALGVLDAPDSQPGETRATLGETRPTEVQPQTLRTPNKTAAETSGALAARPRITEEAQLRSLADGDLSIERGQRKQASSPPKNSAEAARFSAPGAAESGGSATARATDLPDTQRDAQEPLFAKQLRDRTTAQTDGVGEAALSAEPASVPELNPQSRDEAPKPPPQTTPANADGDLIAITAPAPDAALEADAVKPGVGAQADAFAAPRNGDARISGDADPLAQSRRTPALPSQAQPAETIMSRQGAERDSSSQPGGRMAAADVARGEIANADRLPSSSVRTAAEALGRTPPFGATGEPRPPIAPHKQSLHQDQITAAVPNDGRRAFAAPEQAPPPAATNAVDNAQRMAAAENGAQPPRPATFTPPAFGLGFAPTLSAELASFGQPGVAAAAPTGISQADTSSLSSPPAATDAKVVTQQITQAIIRMDGARTEVTLDPVELGRVSLTFVTKDDGVTVVVSADRPETADLLRRNSEMLQRDLSTIGYDGVEFDFEGNDADQRPQSQADGRETPAKAGDDPASIKVIRLDTGLDIRI